MAATLKANRVNYKTKGGSYLPHSVTDVWVILACTSMIGSTKAYEFNASIIRHSWLNTKPITYNSRSEPPSRADLPPVCPPLLLSLHSHRNSATPSSKPRGQNPRTPITRQQYRKDPNFYIGRSLGIMPSLVRSRTLIQNLDVPWCLQILWLIQIPWRVQWPLRLSILGCWAAGEWYRRSSNNPGRSWMFPCTHAKCIAGGDGLSFW